MGKQQSFSEAHPILNTILAIIIFLGFVFICILFLKWLITVIGNSLLYSRQTNTKVRSCVVFFVRGKGHKFQGD